MSAVLRMIFAVNTTHAKSAKRQESKSCLREKGRKMKHKKRQLKTVYSMLQMIEYIGHLSVLDESRALLVREYLEDMRDSMKEILKGTQNEI